MGFEKYFKLNLMKNKTEKVKVKALHCDSILTLLHWQIFFEN